MLLDHLTINPNQDPSHTWIAVEDYTVPRAGSLTLSSLAVAARRSA